MKTESRPLPNSIEEINRLIGIFPKPLIGLKSYAQFIRSIESENVEFCNACFYDFILHCNACALRELQMDQEAIECARDYFHLAVEMFTEIKGVSFAHSFSFADPSNNEYQELAETDAIDWNVRSESLLSSAEEPNEQRKDASSKQTLLIPNTVEDSSLVLLSMTFSNWAVAELTGKNLKFAYTLWDLLKYFAPSEDGASLGFRFDIARNINAALLEIMKCNFPEASAILENLAGDLEMFSDDFHTKLRAYEEEIKKENDLAKRMQRSDLEDELDPQKVSGGRGKGEGGVSSLDGSDATSLPTVDDEFMRELWDINTLQAVVQLCAGVAQEYTNGDAAESHYYSAINFFGLAGISNSEDAPRSYLLQTAHLFLEKMRSFAEEEKEKREKEEAESQYGRDLKRKSKDASKKSKKTKGRNQSVAAESNVYVPPPIGSSLRSYIRNVGLPVVPAMLFRLDDALKMFLPLSLCDDFVSPLCGTQVDEHYYVVSAAVPSETPFQWAVNVDKFRKAPPKMSVWSPRAEFPPYIMLPSDDFAEEVTVRSMKPVLKTLLPRPLPQSTINAAEVGLNTALKFLSTRLVNLIKVEKAFEDRWAATERIKKALQAYYVPQMMIAWKKKRIEDQKLVVVRENHAARVLQQFFRLVVEVKPRQYGFKGAPERRMQEVNDASVVLQKYVRRYLARRQRKSLENLRAAQIRLITFVQSMWRGKILRRWYAELLAEKAREDARRKELATREFAAVVIQSNYRRHLTQLLFWQYQGYTMKAIKHHLRDSRHYYATVLQKHCRGIIVRKAYGKAVYASRCLGRNKYWSKVYNNACVAIQRIFRGWRTRQIMKNAMYFCNQRLEARKSYAESLQIAAVVTRKKEADAELDLAAAKIQSLVRRALAKGIVNSLKKARDAQDQRKVYRTYIPLKDREY